MKKNKIVGVITGDIINSSSLSEKSKSDLKKQLEVLTNNNPGIQLPLQFFRGDSFQLMCAAEKTASLAVLIQAVVISTAGTLARISVGIGQAALIKEGEVLQSDGEAFVLSGHQLDEMKPANRIFKVAVANEKIRPSLEITTLLAENIILDWKPGQATVISMNPQALSQREIADNLNISAAAVSKTLKATKWAAIEQYLTWFENTIKKLGHE